MSRAGGDPTEPTAGDARVGVLPGEPTDFGHLCDTLGGSSGSPVLDWSSGVESAVAIDREKMIWQVEARIPLAAIGDRAPSAGTRWRMNLFRHDVANRAFLAWNPTLTDTTHTPERFGWLEFGE